jgi:hypothetical protein
MVAYSFQKRFADAVLAGLEPGPWRPGMKRWTLRHDRRRHARPGEAVQLYTGMRTRSCRLLGRAQCQAVVPVLIGWDDAGRWTIDLDFTAHVDDLRVIAEWPWIPAPLRDLVEQASVGREPEDGAPLGLDDEALDRFARADGFTSAAEMEAFFIEGTPDRRRYPALGWGMWLITWSPPHGDPADPDEADADAEEAAVSAELQRRLAALDRRR